MVEVTTHGRSVARGEFTIDATRARAKLRDFQLANPFYYVLEFLKSAHLLGADRFDVGQSDQGLVVEFDGQPPTIDELEELYQAAFTRRSDPRRLGLRHLALGAIAAGGAGFGELSLEVGGEAPCEAVLDGNDITIAPADLPPQFGLRITLCRDQEQTLLDRFRGVFGLSSRRARPSGNAERRVLRERARFSQVAVRFEDELISRGLELGEEVDALHRAQEPFEARVVGVALDERERIVHVLQHGVLIATDELPMEDCTYGVRAIVDSGRLTVNLSQSAFVEDDQWDELHLRIDRDARAALAEAFLDERDGGHSERHLELLMVLLAELRRREEFGDLAAHLANHFEDLQVFTSAVITPGDDPKPLSIAAARHTPGHLSQVVYSEEAAEIEAAVRPSSKILCLPKRYPPLNQTHHEIRSHQGYLVNRAALEWFADGCRNVTSELKRHAENARKWRASPHSLEGIDLIDVERREVDNAEISIGRWETSPLDRSRTWEYRVVKDGHILRRERVEGVHFNIYFEVITDVEPEIGFDRIPPHRQDARFHTEMIDLMWWWLQRFSKIRLPKLTRLAIGAHFHENYRKWVGWALWPIGTPFGRADLEAYEEAKAEAEGREPEPIWPWAGRAVESDLAPEPEPESRVNSEPKPEPQPEPEPEPEPANELSWSEQMNWARELLEFVGGIAPDLSAEVGFFVEIDEGDGARAITSIGRQRRLIVDIAHPTIAEGLARPDDPIARKMAAAAIYRTVAGDTTPAALQRRAAFLKGLATY